MNARHASDPAPPLKVLFVVSEAHPLIKTGGLGDVAGSLPAALTRLGCDVRLLLPAYRAGVERAGPLKSVAEIRLPGGVSRVAVLAGTLPGSRVRTWLVDYPPAFDRAGSPYVDATGRPWDDNADRFALFARVATELAAGRTKLAWRPDVVHCHDWQTGLVPALLALETPRPASIFTIHNLSYQGLFPQATLARLGLPPQWWSFDRLEFHGALSFIKGGLVYADKLTTVSPTYAAEIQTPAYGCGLDGLLRYRAADLVGILNGIDGRAWDPAHDPHLAAHYSARRPTARSANKQALQAEFGLPAAVDVPLIGMVGRLVAQKGIDQVLHALPQLMQRPLQMVVLGTGMPEYERALTAFAAHHADQIAVRIGYDEHAAHRIEGGADMFLMPSRFEPCGLNQLYSLRYGSVPIVRRVGGLADTVVDASAENLAAGRATGITFDQDGIGHLLLAVDRALALYRDKAAWTRLMRTGMMQDFSWEISARHYLDLYAAVAARR